MTDTTTSPCPECAGTGCDDCRHTGQRTVAQTLYAAAADTRSNPSATAVEKATAELLERVADDMGPGVTEQQFAQSGGGSRWFVVDPQQPNLPASIPWTAALVLARLILGEPDPNTAQPKGAAE